MGRYSLPPLWVMQLCFSSLTSVLPCARRSTLQRFMLPPPEVTSACLLQDSMEVSICLALPPSVLQHSFLPQCVLANGRGNTSLLHIRTHPLRHYSLGAWAIRNTGLALLLNHFQSAHSKKKCVRQLIFAIIPQVWC